MDITELLKKIESGETTASDAEWLRNREEETRVFIGKQAVRYSRLHTAAKNLLAIIEEEPLGLTLTTFCNSEKTALKQLKDALAQESPVDINQYGPSPLEKAVDIIYRNIDAC